MAYLSNSYRVHRQATRSRAVVDRLLRLVFPAQSERAIAERAAPVLNLSERHVRRLLRQEHDANVTTFVTLMLLAGFEVATDLIYGSDV